MNAVEYRFLEPLDVLFLRGNKLFGDPGSFGESLLPPWPSVAAGAIRSQMLAADDVDLGAFAAGRFEHPRLGTPEQPGTFAITAFSLARRIDGGIESLHRLPADLVASREDGRLGIRRLRPAVPAAAVCASASLPMLAVLAAGTRAKPESGLWLTQAGWQQYVNGETPPAAMLIESRRIWKVEPRVGVGLDRQKRRAQDGMLFTAQAVALQREYGFLAGVEGAAPPADGLLPFGGDGRAAAVSEADYRTPEPDYQSIASAGRCRVVLTTPGIFPEGWRLPGVRAENRFSLHGVTGQLVCAAVPRAEVVSGWDLAKWQPKPAQRTAPAGSVYWLEELQATPEALRKLAERGLWNEPCEDDVRRAEGFNRFTFAVY